MIIREFSFHPFNIRLKEPLKNSSFQINSRKGFIIKIIDEKNNVGFGEVAPLIGISKETLEECEIELNRMHYTIIEKGAKGETLDLGEELSKIQNLPSLLFGFESAIISLLLIRGELGDSFNLNKHLFVNGLVGIMQEKKMLNKVDELLASGIKTIKLKAGVNSVEDDVKFINKIASRIDSSIKLRIDVNGKWSYQQTEYAIEHLDKSKVEYLEQPVSGINEIVMLSDYSPIPIAVDELVTNMDEAFNIVERSNINVLVIKPSLLGSLMRTISLIKIAERMKKKIVISSAFETVVGRSALVFLASIISGKYAHGLGTAAFLKSDLSDDSFPVVEGKIKYSYQGYPPEFTGLKL